MPGASLRKTTSLRLALLAGLGLIAACPGARAEPYPSQDIHLISAFPPGSGADVLVRYVAEKLRPIAGRNVIVENKPGAGGNIATEYVVRSKPDGYTILVHSANTLASNVHLIRNNPVDAGKQIQVAATLNRLAFMLVVDPKRPFKTVAELTAFAKEKGDKATVGVVGNGSIIMCSIYKEQAGLTAVDVAYKMARDTLNDLASGAVDFSCQDPVFALSQQREGRLRILATASGERMAFAPEIPTMKELGYPMDLVGWFAAMVPTGTPRPVIDQINAWFAKIHQDPDTPKFLNNFGGVPWITTPEQGQARLRKDIADFAEYVRIAKLKPQG
ncbi:MAG TPA: tripartite tricarboxylate transporter substrate binding protein [Xanthobacteraceae bacterium]|nr:tripartite tricarboxylate transporter substrate binding protein [Xanthobacteraceae bacterium]